MAVLGLAEIKAALKKVGIEADVASRSTIAQAAALVEARAKANFEGAHSKREPHVGGAKPNVVTGTLRRSITHEAISRYGLGEYGTRIGPSTVYARRVELGYPGGTGRGHGKTRAFPYFTPAVTQTKPEIAGIAAAQWRKFIRL